MNPKVREYVVTGVTNALRDGQTRNITLVGVLIEESGKEPTKTIKAIPTKRGQILTIIEEYVDTFRATFAIGMSVLNPIDIGYLEEGKMRAKGRAMKPTKALVTLATNDRFFGDDTANSILNLQLARIIGNPDKFIKVSAKKSNNDVDLPIIVKVASLKTKDKSHLI